MSGQKCIGAGIERFYKVDQPARLQLNTTTRTEKLPAGDTYTSSLECAIASYRS